MGVEYGNDSIASLLLMDDIVLVADSRERLQEMLNALDACATKWHLTFSQEKSKVMIIKPIPNKRKLSSQHQGHTYTCTNNHMTPVTNNTHHGKSQTTNTSGSVDIGPLKKLAIFLKMDNNEDNKHSCNKNELY